MEIVGDIGYLYAKGSNRRAAESTLRDVAVMHLGHPVSNIKLTGGRYIFDGNIDEPQEEEDGDSGSSRLVASGGPKILNLGIQNCKVELIFFTM
jgi:hypothetical protein